MISAENVQNWNTSGGPILLDGGLATELERRGFDVDDPLWSGRVLLEEPSAVQEVHRDFLAAGAEVLISASYQLTYEGLAARGLGRKEVDSLLVSSVALAREVGANRAAARGPWVAASVGPYGAFLHDGSEYRGDYSIGRKDLVRFHRDRFAVLSTSGADVLACESLPCLGEAEALLELLEEHPSARAWFSFTCRNGTQTSRGEPIEEVGRLLGTHDQVVAVGINCSAPSHLESLLSRLAELLPHVAGQLRRERALADPRRIGLGHSQHAIDRARRHTQPGAHAADRGIR